MHCQPHHHALNSASGSFGVWPGAANVNRGLAFFAHRLASAPLCHHQHFPPAYRTCRSSSSYPHPPVCASTRNCTILRPCCNPGPLASYNGIAICQSSSALPDCTSSDTGASLRNQPQRRFTDSAACRPPWLPRQVSVNCNCMLFDAAPSPLPSVSLLSLGRLSLALGGSQCFDLHFSSTTSVRHDATLPT